jgi:aminotransferase
MRNAYKARRDLVVGLLGQAGVRASVPRGAFYVFVDVSRLADHTYRFTRQLLQEQRVAVAPGETFGDAGCGHVRVSLAVDPQVLEAGVRRLIAALTRQSRGT